MTLQCQRGKAAAVNWSRTADGVAARCQMRIFGHVAEGTTSVPSLDQHGVAEMATSVRSGSPANTENFIHADCRMLYRGDFVYTEELSDLRICRDHLLGKL